MSRSDLIFQNSKADRLPGYAFGCPDLLRCTAGEISPAATDAVRDSMNRFSHPANTLHAKEKRLRRSVGRTGKLPHAVGLKK